MSINENVEKNVPFTSRTPTYLTPEQRHTLTQIPADLSDREIARYYTFTQKDLDLFHQRRRRHNLLGFAVQLAVLRFPGRPLKDGRHPCPCAGGECGSSAGASFRFRPLW